MRLYSSLPRSLAWLLVAAAALSLCGCGDGRRGSVLEHGMEALARGRYAKALPLLRQAAQADPDSATAQGNLGVALWHAGELNDAAEAFRRAAALSANDPRALAFLGHVATQLGDWSRAADALALALNEDPHSPSLLTSQARVQRQLGEADTARSLLHKALESDPGYVPALFGMAVVMKEAGDTAQAETYFRRLLTASDTGPEADSARAFLGRGATAAAPDDPATHVTAAEGAQRLVRAARRAVERREYESALFNLKRAAESYPDEPDALWELALLYDRHLGFKDRAAEYYREFRKRFPADPRVAHIPALPQAVPHKTPAETAREAFARGLTAYEARDWAVAIREFKQALAFDRNYADAAYNLALACNAAGQLDDAREHFLQALKLRPDTPGARYMVAVIARTQGRTDEAATQLKLLLADRPGYAKAHLLLGYVYQDGGKHTESRRHFEQYVELAPDGPSAQRIRQWLNSTQ